VVGYYNAGDRMKVWGKTGAFWGGLWGLLFGSAFFWIPGLGPLLVAGPLVSWIVGALEGAVVVGGLSAMGAGLYSLGIPKDSILRYETALKTDKFVLISFVIKAEVPEVKREDVSVTVNNGVLSVCGERKQEEEEKGKTFHRVERHYGSFCRSFTLPENVDEANIKATFKDGMLSLEIPKTEKATPKTIEVKVE
jgi:HSP20 family molecular chaperone IbpA